MLIAGAKVECVEMYRPVFFFRDIERGNINKPRDFTVFGSPLVKELPEIA